MRTRTAINPFPAPRCQRTFERIGSARPGGAYPPCPFCPDAESYAPVEDADLLLYARLAYSACVSDFGTPSDAAWPLRVTLGLSPECVREPGERFYDVYLQRGCDPLQLRLQIGHELFHRVCSQGRVFHWSHEMLACLQSVRLLRRFGFDAYAQTMDAEYTREAALLSVAVLQTAPVYSPPYPPGLYGRAYHTGRELETVVGWQRLCRLARCLDRTGTVPDVARWLRALPAEQGNKASAILGITSQ